MTRIIKSTVSVLLAVAILVALLLTALMTSGVSTVSAAASSTYKNELWLVTDYEYGMSSGSRFAIDGGAMPYAYETGTAYIPLSAVCHYTGASHSVSGSSVTVTRSDGSTATLTVGDVAWSGGEFLLPVTLVDGCVYLSILSAKDVFSLQSFYNSDIGLVVLSRSSMSYSKSHSSLSTQIDTLSNLLFDRPSQSKIYEDLEANATASQHPRILVRQDDFDRLRGVYLDEDADDMLSISINAYIAGSAAVFNTYFKLTDDGTVDWKYENTTDSIRQPYFIYDENGNRLVGTKTYTYTDGNGEEITIECDGSGRGDGYDYGGRSNVDKFTVYLKQFAFAWQMTGDNKYRDAFYLLATELGKWQHWGEGHFLDAADGAVEYAIGLDWIWHAFDDEPEKRDELASILYNKGLMKGYYSIAYNSSSGSIVDGLGYIDVSYTAGSTAWRIKTRNNNWQTVCGSGMIISGLVLAEYDEYRANSLYVISECIKNTEYCLLQYAPDGAYIESPGYWGYGTNTLMLTIAALRSGCGTDYGLSDIIGLYDSFYFAAGIADSDYRMWNYHDSGSGSVDSSLFYFAARIFGDPSLAAYRNGFLTDLGRNMTVYDILFYDSTLADGAESMKLDNNFKGIDSVTLRSSWEPGAVFTGLHTGPSHVTHGDFDTGNFTLSMGGVQWIVEPGTENYNISGFWNTSESGRRYRLYGKSAEGHSTVVIRNNSSLPLGQKYTTFSTSYPVINEFYTDELGAYAYSNMTVQYGSTCTSGYRGVLLTNSRSTVVLQDEITFSEPTSLTSILNLAHNIRMSDDGRTVKSITYVDGEKRELRVTLLSDNEDLKFTYMYDPSVTIFDSTVTKQNSGDDMALTPVQRVVINADGVTEYKVALVFELIGHEDEVVGYEYTPMTQWQTSSDEWVKEANKDIVYEEDKTKPKYVLSDFIKANAALAEALESGDDAALVRIVRETFIYTTDYDSSNKNVVAAVREYMGYVDRYNFIIRGFNSAFTEEFVK
ncbi:MAG: heparinase II/III family protein [Clostridia bacterium]|nr:heparinase II/III family protein [Clostridia bacterium]